jgi:hypothetical protein
MQVALDFAQRRNVRKVTQRGQPVTAGESIGPVLSGLDFPLNLIVVPETNKILQQPKVTCIFADSRFSASGNSLQQNSG